MKVVTVIGTRPEIIRLSAIIKRLDTVCEHILIHTGQNYDYELSEIFFKDLGLRAPDHVLEAGKGSKTPMEFIGEMLKGVDKLLEVIQPDAFVVLGDTNSCLSVVSAKRRKIPIFHLEAGNRCFDQCVPEEINRKIVDHTSDINLTYSSIAREYLISEGFPKDQIIKIGSPMKEVLLNNKEKIDQSDVLTKLKLNRDDFYLMSFHREENVTSESRLKELICAINNICCSYKKRVVISAHPRTYKALESLGMKLDDRAEILKPLSFSDYNRLQLEASVVLSDSGTISEEASLQGFKAINLRDVHERPEAMEEAAVVLCGTDTQNIMEALEILHNSDRVDRSVFDYEVENVSDKVVRIVFSYIGFVNSRVWRKSGR